MKYLNINLTKYVENLYKENDKTEKLQNYKTPLFFICPVYLSKFSFTLSTFILPHILYNPVTFN